MRLAVLWQRVVAGGETCCRCADTGGAVRRAVDRLALLLAPRGIAVELEERALPPFAVAESNRVFINGVAVEELLGARVGMNACASCGDLLGCPTDCRTLVLDGKEYEALPEELLVRAGLAAARNLSGNE